MQYAKVFSMQQKCSMQHLVCNQIFEKNNISFLLMRIRTEGKKC